MKRYWGSISAVFIPVFWTVAIHIWFFLSAMMPSTKNAAASVSASHLPSSSSNLLKMELQTPQVAHAKPCKTNKDANKARRDSAWSL